MPRKGNRKGQRSRNWCFTLYEKFDPTLCFEHKENDGKFRYICAGQEICPETGRQHIQGWCQFNEAKSFGQCKKLLRSNSVHIEQVRGSCDENDEYCKKDGKWKSCGNFRRMGERMDISEVHEMLKDGASVKEIAEANFQTYLKFPRAIDDYRQIISKENAKAWRSVEVILISGATGTNKTRWAATQADYIIRGHSLEWWDGYCDEKTILIDEYANDIKVTKLISLLDGYQLRLPVKGGFTYARWNKIIITTNLRELHHQAIPEHQAALQRRITETRTCWNGETIDLQTGLPV